MDYKTLIMKKYYILLITLFVLAFSSCEKILDKEPTDKISLEDLFRDVAGSKTALAGAYKALLEESHYQRNLMVYADILGGNIKFSKTSNLRLDDVYDAAQNAQESSMNETYSYLYSELNNVNNIIKYTPTAEGSGVEKAKIIAEAKCIRALIHFDLVRIFARPFNFSVDGSHLGIPLVLQPQLFADPSPVRATVAQTYQAIITDLNDAVKGYYIGGIQEALDKAYIEVVNKFSNEKCEIIKNTVFSSEHYLNNSGANSRKLLRHVWNS